MLPASAHFPQPGQGPQKALLWRSHHQPWAERTLAGSAWSRHPPTPATVPLSLLAMLQVPKKIEDFEAKNQLCLPKGQCPREQRSKRMEFAVVLCRLWVVI